MIPQRRRAVALQLLLLHVASAFQVPIIFPLIWIARRAPSPAELLRRPRLPSLPPLLNFVALLDKSLKRPDGTERLVEWIESAEEDDGGGFGRRPGVKIEIDTKDGLRGLYATSDVRRGELLVEVSYSAALLVGDTLNQAVYDDFSSIPGSDKWDEEDVEDVYQGLGFLSSFAKDDEYSPYISTLPPRPDDVSTTEGLPPDYWPRSTIEQIQIPDYSSRILSRKDIVENVVAINKVPVDELQWATWMMRSRRFTTWNMVDDPNSEDQGLFGKIANQNKVEQIQGFLIPLIDMANHAQDPNAALKISVNRWTREFDESSSFALRALRPIRKGEQVTICYGEGDRNSLDLLEKYGFFVPDNEADGDIDWNEMRTEFTGSVEMDVRELAEMDSAELNGESGSKRSALKNIISNLQDYRPELPRTLSDGLALVGSGTRTKMGITTYGVGLYAPQTAADDIAAASTLEEREDALSNGLSQCSIVLEIALGVETKVVASALADSLRRRYDRSDADVKYLQNLIEEGVGSKNTAVGTKLRFDCSYDKVGVSVDGSSAGEANFEGIGQSFVDIFTDDESVAPGLVEDCLLGPNGGSSSGQVDESRRAMLRLRVLMKKLSGWTVPEGSGSPPDLETVVETETRDVSTIVVEEDIQPEPPAAAVGEGVGGAADEGPTVAAIAVEPEAAAAVETPPPLQQQAAPAPVANDPADTKANEIEERIRQLELEIQAEIARVEGGAPQMNSAAATAVYSESPPQSSQAASAPSPQETAQAPVDGNKELYGAIESKMKPIKEKATGVTFEPKLGDGLYLVGAGVRKKVR